MVVSRAPADLVLHAVDLVKRYGSNAAQRPALAGLSLAAAPGEIVGLLGPNGAGKSTFVSIVAGVLRADAGRVHVRGIDVGTAPAAAAAYVGVAPQETGLFEVLTVRENLHAFATLRGLRGRIRSARIDEVAVALRLAHLMDRSVQALSGGERRRAHTAIAFLHRPSLLLLDEPTVGADMETRHALLDVVRAAASEGAAVVYSTHYLPEIEMLGASVAILVEGVLIASGPLDELVGRYAHASVELTFAVPPPPSILSDLTGAIGAPVTVEGAVVRVPARDPAALVPTVLRQLGDAAAALDAVTLRRADLDAVYVALTGARLEQHHELVTAP